MINRGEILMWARDGFRRPRGLGFASVEGAKCLDCGGSPEAYLVQDRLWKAAGMSTPSGGLCLTHFALRLGCPLEPRDFLYGEHHERPDGGRETKQG
jgi:hypothetical protein